MGQPAPAVPSLGLAGSERGCETSPGQAPAWGCWSSAREPGMLSGGEREFSVLGLGALLVAHGGTSGKEQEGWHRALPSLLDVPRVLSSSPASSYKP